MQAAVSFDAYRTTKILEEINLLFEERDFELRANKKLRKINRYKIQPILNINGTVTVVASYGNGNAVYITFYGNGLVELWSAQESFLVDCKVVEIWPGLEAFLIDREKETPEEIRKRFRNMLETKYKFEFKNGGQSWHCKYTIKFLLKSLIRACPVNNNVFWVFHSFFHQIKIKWSDNV